MTVPNWLPAPQDLTLSPPQVHVWRIELDQPQTKLQNFTATLSGDELARAQRFYFEEHRQRFIAGRGIVRSILARYLGITAGEVEFDYQARGKPVLAPKFADSGLWFNLSNSQGLGLCGVSYRQIGIDLEYIRPMSDLEALAQRFFLPREYDVVRSLPPHLQQQVFFRYWTCKEAYLKATGEGIAQLEQVEVLLSLTEAAKLQKSDDWSLQELVPADNYVAAVAVAGLGWDLKYWDY